MNRIGIVAIIALVAVAAPQVAHAAKGDSTAPQAAVAKKKKKKHRKRRPAVTTTGAPTAPPVNVCPDDAAEPDDELLSSTLLAYPGSVTPLARYSCPRDTDFFKVTVPERQRFTFLVDADEGFDPTVDIYFEDGTYNSPVDRAGQGGTESLYVFGEQDAPLSWYVGVRSYTAAAAEGAYTIAGYASR